MRRSSRKQQKRAARHSLSEDDRDPVLAWLRATYRTGGSGSTCKSAVYERYAVFCEEEGLEPTSPAAFGKIVHKAFPDVETFRRGPRGDVRYHYQGLRLIAESDDEADEQEARNRPQRRRSSKKRSAKRKRGTGRRNTAKRRQQRDDEDYEDSDAEWEPEYKKVKKEKVEVKQEEKEPAEEQKNEVKTPLASAPTETPPEFNVPLKPPSPMLMGPLVNPYISSRMQVANCERPGVWQNFDFRGLLVSLDPTPVSFSLDTAQQLPELCHGPGQMTGKALACKNADAADDGGRVTIRSTTYTTIHSITTTTESVPLYVKPLRNLYWKYCQKLFAAIVSKKDASLVKEVIREFWADVPKYLFVYRGENREESPAVVISSCHQIIFRNLTEFLEPLLGADSPEDNIGTDSWDDYTYSLAYNMPTWLRCSAAPVLDEEMLEHIVTEWIEFFQNHEGNKQHRMNTWPWPDSDTCPWHTLEELSY